MTLVDLPEEFFAIAFQQAVDSKITRGSLPNVTFMHDQAALANGDYKTFGQLVALSFLNGVGGPHIFSPTLAHFILGTKESLHVEDIIEKLRGANIVATLKSLNACTTTEEWAKAFILLVSALIWELTEQQSHLKKKMR